MLLNLWMTWESWEFQKPVVPKRDPVAYKPLRWIGSIGNVLFTPANINLKKYYDKRREHIIYRNSSTYLRTNKQVHYNHQKVEGPIAQVETLKVN